MSVTHLYVVAVVAIFGCASGGSGVSAAHRTAGLLTAEEIASTHADITTAYDAVARLRPNWLAPHGAMTSNSTVSNYSTVFVDGQLQGDITALKNIPGYQVAEIRYYDVTQAGGIFGVRAGTTGAIEVSMKKP
jgi:hypothetical protein